MTTRQNYVGKANNAIPISPTVDSDQNSHSAPDNRPSINPRIYQAQSHLLDLVDTFAARGNYAPLQAASDLLHHWLVTPAQQLTAEDDKDQLHAVLLLIDALSEVYPINSLPSHNPQGERTEPLRLFDRYAIRLAPDLLNHYELTEEEEARAGLLLIPDDSMAPQLLAGNEVLVVAIDPADYGSALGLVVLCPDTAPRRYVLGRVAQNAGGTLLLVRDNPEFAEEQFLLSCICYLGQVRYIINKEVV